MPTPELIYNETSYKIRGCCFHVYNSLGPGHKEIIYQKALAQTFKNQKLTFEIEKRLPIIFENRKIGTYVPDFVVESKIIIETKATQYLTLSFQRQLISYLKATQYKLGFLINFGTSSLDIKRFVN